MIVLDPQSLARATKDRIAMYPAERAGLQRALDYSDIEADELQALNNRVQNLRKQLLQSVEILEEDHGKAIFIFTMVTTIFLPLYVLFNYTKANSELTYTGLSSAVSSV